MGATSAWPFSTFETVGTDTPAAAAMSANVTRPRAALGSPAMPAPFGPVSTEAKRLLEVTKASLFAGVEQMRPGNHLGDVSSAIQRLVEAEGLSIIRTLVGHGVGRDMHEEPQVPNFGEPGKGPELEEGMVLAIEPMVNSGGPLVRMGEDGWSVYSEDDSLAAHFEFTVAVTPDGPRILTPWHLD